MRQTERETNPKESLMSSRCNCIQTRHAIKSASMGRSFEIQTSFY